MKIAEIKQKILAGKVDEVKGKCYFCGKDVDGMFWCFGCYHFICEDCENLDPPMGKHRIVDHKNSLGSK